MAVPAKFLIDMESLGFAIRKEGLADFHQKALAGTERSGQLKVGLQAAIN
jgi:hypothetical protein